MHVPTERWDTPWTGCQTNTDTLTPTHSLTLHLHVFRLAGSRSNLERTHLDTGRKSSVNKGRGIYNCCCWPRPHVHSSMFNCLSLSVLRIYRPIKGLNWSVFRLDTAGAGHTPTLCSHLDLKLCCEPWSAEQEHKSVTKLIKYISCFAATGDTPAD